MCRSICSKCESSEWKSSKMVMLEGVTTSDGSVEGIIKERGVFGEGKGVDLTALFLSDRWFDFEKYSTKSSIKFETVTGLAKAVERAIAVEGAHLRMPVAPDKPKEPRKPSKPWRDRPQPIQATFRPPARFSRWGMWWKRRSGDPLLAVIIGAMYFAFTRPTGVQYLDHVEQSLSSMWMPYGVGFLAIFALYLFSGFVGLKKYNAKREAKAKRKYDRDVESEKSVQESALRRYEKYDADVADWEVAAQEHYRQLRIWEVQYEEWQDTVSKTEAQRLLLWEQLRVCLRCAHVYRMEAA